MIKTIASAPGQPAQNVEMTDDEVSAFQAQQSAMQTAQASATLIQTAQAALDKSDMVALRCIKAGVAFPSDWQAFVTAARANVNGATNPLTQPAYPEGT